MRIEKPTTLTKPCGVLEYCPYGSLVENFELKHDRDEKSCIVFGHDCPVFTVAEQITEKTWKEVFCGGAKT